MAGSWHGDTHLHVISSMKLAGEVMNSGTVFTKVHESTYCVCIWYCWVQVWKVPTDLRVNVDIARNPLRARDVLSFLLKQPALLAEEGIFMASMGRSVGLDWLELQKRDSGI